MEGWNWNNLLLLLFLSSLTFDLIPSSLAEVPGSKYNPEFAKDVASLALESTLESTCNGNVFISTKECGDPLTEAILTLNTWAPPIVLIGYEDSFESFSQTEIEKWINYLKWKDQPCNLIFICDLSKSPNISMGFQNFPKLIRHFDQVIYFSDFDSEFEHFNGSSYQKRVTESERLLLKHTEILMLIKVENHSEDAASTMAISSLCIYCHPGMDPIVETSLGSWRRNQTKLSKFFGLFDFSREPTFHGFNFKIGYFNYKPHFFCETKMDILLSQENFTETECYGVEWEILQKLSSSLDLTFTLSNYTMEGHGLAISESNITGMIGAIHNSSIDIALGGVSVTPERIQYVDFTKVFAQEPIEKRNDIYILGIWLAFQPAVWPLLILTIISVSILLKFSVKGPKKISIFQGFQFSIGALVGQALTHPQMTKKSTCLTKYLLATWWFVCTTTAILYNTCLITSLITPVSFKEPESLMDLVDFGYKFRMNCKQGPVFELLQKDQYEFAQDNILNLIKERLDLENTWEGKIAWVMEESSVQQIDWKKDHGLSNIKIIHERLFLTGYGWAIQSQGPYKEKIDTALGQLGSAGLVNHWYSEYKHHEKEPTDPKFKLRKKLGQISMNLEILQGAFVFLLIGCTIAGLVFLAELWHSNYTFRFLTLAELQSIYNKWTNQKDVKKELLNAGRQAILLSLNPTQDQQNPNHSNPLEQVRKRKQKYMYLN